MGAPERSAEDVRMSVAKDSLVDTSVRLGWPCARLRLSTEHVTVGQEGFERSFETRLLPVLELAFDYGGQLIGADEPQERFFESTPAGPRVVRRNHAEEMRLRRVLEGFGPVEIDCLDGWAIPPGSPATYLLRCDGDVHDFCSFGAWVVPQLRELGWQVTVAEGYPYRVVVEGAEWFARLDPDEKRPDWFSLELGVDLEGSRINLLPALLSLLEGTRTGTKLATLAQRCHKVAVSLPDGRYLAVEPEALVGMLRVLGELYDGERSGIEELCLGLLGIAALPRLESSLRPAGRLRWEGATELLERGERLSSPRPLTEAPPLKATLRDYQREGVEWLQHLGRCGVGGILADDMGLGKTLQTIAHIALEHRAGRLASRPALVVAPTSLCSNWEREIGKFAPHLRTLVLRGPKRRSLYARIERVDVVITSYPILVRDEERLAERDWHLLILDEAHSIKNTRSLAHGAAKRQQATQRICLTGTPVENHLGELWALMDFLNPGVLGDELAFRRWYRVPIEQYGDEERMASLRQRIQPFLLRRMKREVATELPPKTELFRPVRLGAKQRALYESIRVAAHADIRKVIAERGLSSSTIPILDALTKLRQVCCDPRLVPLRSARSVRRSAKYEQLFELVGSQLGRGHRILVFSQFTRMLALIERGMQERGIRTLTLTGQSRERQGLVDRFEAGEAEVFLISLKAGGVGLTLTSADTVVHYDPWWNPTAQDQATDRAYRIGQTRPVVAYNLFVQGSVEERMLALQARKRRLAEGILHGSGAGFRWTEDDVEELFAPLL